MAVLGEAFVRVRPETTGFGAETEAGVLGGLRGIAVKGAAILGGIFAVRESAKFIGDLVKDGEALTKQQNLVGAALASTGNAAHLNTAGLRSFAESQAAVTGTTATSVTQLQQLLIRFTNIRNEVGKGNNIFDRAEQSILNVAAARGKSLSASSLAVGKALQDPVHGLTSLVRLGIQFDQQQKDQIKTLVASGNVLGAQRFILDSLTQRYGGAAAAAATFTEKLHAEVANVKDIVGQSLEPAVAAVVTGLSPVIPEIGKIVSEGVKAIIPAIVPALQQIGPLLEGVVKAAAPILIGLGGALAQALGGLAPIFQALGSIVSSFAPLFKPLGDVIGALAKTFSAVFTPTLLGIAKVIGQIVNAALPPLTAALRALGPILDAVGKTVGGNIAFAFGQLAQAIGPVIELLSGLFSTALQAILPVLPQLAFIFSAIASAAVQFGSAFLKGVLPGLEALLTAVVPLLGPLGRLAELLAHDLSEAIFRLEPVIVQVGTQFGQAFGQLIQGLLPVLPSLVNAFVQLAQAVVQVVIAFLPAIPAAVQFTTVLLKNIGAPTIIAIADAFTAFALAITPVVRALTPLIELLVGFKPLVDAVVAAFITFKTVSFIANTFDTAAFAIRDFRFALRGIIVAEGPGSAGAFLRIVAAISKFNAAIIEATASVLGLDEALATGGVAGAFEALTGISLGAALTMAAFVVAGSAAIGAISALIVKLFDAGGALRGVGIALGVLTEVFTLPVIAIVALVRNFDTLKNAIGGFITAIPGAFTSAISAIGSALGTAVSAVSGFIGSVVSAVASAGNAVGGAFAELFTGIVPSALSATAGLGAALIGAVGRAAAAAVAAAPGLFVDLVQFFATLPAELARSFAFSSGFLLGLFARAAVDVATALPGLFAAVIGFFQALPGQIVSAVSSLGSALASIGTTAQNALTSAVTAAAASLPGLLDSIVQFFQQLPGRIVGALSTAGNALVSVGGDLIGGLVSGIVAGASAAGAAISNFFASIPGLVASAASTVGPAIGGALVTAGGAAIGGIVVGARAALGGVTAFFQGIPDFVTSKVPAGGTWLVGIGQDVIDGLVSGIVSAAKSVGNFFQSIVAEFVKGFEDSFGISSPATVMIPIGEDILLGIVQGAVGAVGNLISFIAGIPGEVINAVGSVGSLFGPLGAALIDGIIEGAVGAFGALDSFFGGIPGRVLGAITGAASTLISVGGALIEGIVQGASAAVGNVVNFFTTLPSRVIAVASNPSAFLAMGAGFISSIVEGAVGALGNVLSFFGSLPGRIVGTVPAAALTPIGANFLAAIGRGAALGLGAVLSFFGGLASRIASTVQAGVGTLVPIGAQFVTAIRNGASGAIGSVLSFFGGVVSQVRGALTGARNALVSVGGDFIAGLRDGIVSAAESVFGHIPIIGSRIVKSLKSSLGVRSPSVLTRQIGQDVMQGLTNGITTGSSAAFQAASGTGKKVIDLIVESVKSQGGKVSDEFKNILDNAAKNSTRTSTGFATSAEQFTQSFTDAINARFSSGFNVDQALAAFGQEHIVPQGALTGDEFSQAFNTFVQAKMGEGLTLPQAVKDFGKLGLQAAFDPGSLGAFQAALTSLQGQFLQLGETLRQKGAIDTVTKTFNESTQAGNSAKSAFIQYGQGIIQVAQQNLDANHNIDAVRFTLTAQAGAFLQSAEKAGISRKSFVDLATAQGLIRPDLKASVKTDADVATAIVKTFLGEYNKAADTKTANVNVHVSGEGDLLRMRDEIRQLSGGQVTVVVAGHVIRSPGKTFQSWSDTAKYVAEGLRTLLAREEPAQLLVHLSQAKVGSELHPLGAVGGAVNAQVQSGLARSQLRLPPVIVPTVQDVSMIVHAAQVDVRGGSIHSLSTAGAAITNVVQSTITPVSIPASVTVSITPEATANIKTVTNQIVGSLSEIVSGATSALPQASNAVATFGQAFASATTAVAAAQGKVRAAQAALAATHLPDIAGIAASQRALAEASRNLDAAERSRHSTAAQILTDIAAVRAAEAALAAARVGQITNLHDYLVDTQKLQEAQKNLAAAQHSAAVSADITGFIHQLQSQSNAAKQFIADLSIITKVAPQLAADLAKAGPEAAGALTAAFAHNLTQAKAAEAALLRANGAATNLTNFLTKTFGPLLGTDTGTQVGQDLASGIANGLLGVLPAARAIVGQLKDVLGDVSNVTLTPQLVPQLAPTAAVPVFATTAPTTAAAASATPAVLQLDVTLTNPDGTVTEFLTSPITVTPGASLVQRVQAQTRAQ